MKAIRTYYELQYLTKEKLSWRPFGGNHVSAESAEKKLKEAIRFHTEVYNLETKYRIIKKTVYSEIIKEF